MSTSMYGFRNVFRNPALCKTAVRTIQMTFFGRKILGTTSLGLCLAKCEGMEPTANDKQENLSHEHCIKQACVMAVNSATTLLTTTAAAVLDTCKRYKESLTRLVGLLEQSLLTDGEIPELWDHAMEVRADVNKTKAALSELNIYMESVEKLVNSTTEAAFLAGADYMCTVLCERLYSVQKEISQNISEIKKLEEDYLKAQQEIIKSLNTGEKTEKKDLKENMKPEEILLLNENEKQAS